MGFSEIIQRFPSQMTKKLNFKSHERERVKGLQQMQHVNFALGTGWGTITKMLFWLQLKTPECELNTGYKNTPGLEENTLVLRRCILKCSGVTGHDD